MRRPTEASTRPGKGDPQRPSLSAGGSSGFLSRPEVGQSSGAPPPSRRRPPWHVTLTFTDCQTPCPYPATPPERVPPASVFPQAPLRPRSRWPPAWGPGAGRGILGAWPSEREQSYLIPHSVLLVALPDYLLIRCCCIQLTSCALSGSCWAGF